MIDQGSRCPAEPSSAGHRAFGAGFARSVALARGYFAVQAAAGTLWWLAVFGVFGDGLGVREATLGRIDPVLMALADVPLFVLASALVACGLRWAAWIAVPWTTLVSLGLAGYATITGDAGWGALIMAAAAIGSVFAWMLLVFGRIPSEKVLRGPLGFGLARSRAPGRQLVRTLAQMLVFWAVFLLVIPGGIRLLELRWQVGLDVPPEAADVLRACGLAVLAGASALGLSSAIAMALRGDGTPLPSAAANRLVIAGPYRFVRNPMAVAGIAQAIGVGFMLGSWLVVAYALCGAVYWNALVRPSEEADLATRFGDEFERYRGSVRCWWPRLVPVAAQ